MRIVCWLSAARGGGAGQEGVHTYAVAKIIVPKLMSRKWFMSAREVRQSLVEFKVETSPKDK